MYNFWNRCRRNRLFRRVKKKKKINILDSESGENFRKFYSTLRTMISQLVTPNTLCVFFVLTFLLNSFKLRIYSVAHACMIRSNRIMTFLLIIRTYIIIILYQCTQT